MNTRLSLTKDELLSASMWAECSRRAWARRLVGRAWLRLRSVFFFFLIQTGLCLTASCLRCLPSPYSNSAAFNTKVTKGQRCSLLFCQRLWVVGSSSSAVEFTVFLQHVFPSSPTHKALLVMHRGLWHMCSPMFLQWKCCCSVCVSWERNAPKVENTVYTSIRVWCPIHRTIK